MLRKDVLPNGIRVVSEAVPHVESVSVGIWLGSGGRDENDSNRGISHFIEHTLFKGTETRSAKQIAGEFDSIGGHLNAFTEREYTCYFAKVLKEHLPVAVEVVADMLLNSLLDPNEMGLEKNVVLEEIKRHEDSPDDLVHDLFAQTVWNGHPLGRPIMGSREAVESLVREDLIEFMRSKYTPDNVVVSAAGNLVHEELINHINLFLGGMKGGKVVSERRPPSFSNESLLTYKSIEQIHFCIGTQGCSQLDDDKYTLAVIDTALGGSMSSRLFQKIREDRGLVYAIASYSASYSDGGLFAVYGGTSLENVEEVVQLIKSEFESMCKDNLTDDELNRAKNQIRGALVLGQESMSSRMARMAKCELYFGRVIPLEELIGNITKVTSENVARVAETIFREPLFPVVAVGPFRSQEVVARA